MSGSTGAELGSSPEPLGEELGDRRIEADLPVVRGADRLDHRALAGLLEEVPSRTSLEGRDDLLFLDEACECDDLGLWMPCPDLADRGDAVLRRHDEVHEDDVRPAGLRQSNGLLAVGRVTDDLHVVHRLQQSAQPAANDGVVVDDEDADRLGVGHLATPCAAPAVCPRRIRPGAARVHAPARRRVS